ncbi:(2Fe-2S)-binding protein [Haloglycomyces albus]|uniref:(2Fe-2S)-binding protein n=1 Tax=Haloglycomyces albus TaxID=526067 RepID=UPI00046D22EB|nr:(2Fe-2S)-binding protein [Haloglycomyces albus]
MVWIDNTLFQSPGYVGPRVLTADGDHWRTLAELFANGSTLLATHMSRYGEAEEAPEDTTAAYFIGWMTGLYVRPALWAVREHGLLPEYDPAAISVRLHSSGWYDAVSFSRGPARRLDGSAARKALAEYVHSLGADLVESIGRHTRLGNRALWAHVTDTFADAFLPRPALGDDAVAASTDADATLAEASFPTPGPRWVHYEGATVGLGQSCCMSYKVPGGTNCAPVCPKISEDERRMKLAEWRNALPDRRDS